MSSCITAKAIEALQHVFVVHSLPEKLVSDNGAQLISDKLLIIFSWRRMEFNISEVLPIIQPQMYLQSILFKLPAKL